LAAATRDFFKPQVDEKQHKPPVTKDMVESFSVDPNSKAARNFELQQMLEEFLVKEARCKAGVADVRIPHQNNTSHHITSHHITTQHNTTQHNTTQHNTTQHNTTRCLTTC